MSKIRFGVVGVGGMGGGHCKNIVGDRSKDFCLAAVADNVPEIAERVGREHGVPHFTDAQAMYDSGLIDAVIIATPHYWHPPLTIRAARAGLHVLCEKPLAVTVGEARTMIAECRKRKVALGCVLQHRTRGIMIKARQLVQNGSLGEVFRVQLICSSWFRTQAYYDSGSWRGTWDGEGGGVLINQGPHHLDLFQWIGGMPKRMIGVIDTRAHRIEVEDAANLTLQYDNGKIGYIYATTAEEPGMEQLMVCGDKATMVVEKGQIRLGKLKIPVSKHIMESKRASAGGAEQEMAWQEVKYADRKGKSGHIEIVRGFVRHILNGQPMYATGEEALNELELSNAAYLAGYEDRAVDLPVDAQSMDRLIARLVKQRATGRGGDLRSKAGKDLKALLKN